MSGPRRRSAALRLVVANVAVLTALLAGVEGTVRLTHPEIRPPGTDARLIADSVHGPAAAPRAGTAGMVSGAVRHVDARGLWQTRHARPGLPAWLFLGDSVTMGLGVDDDTTFVARVGAAVDTLDVQNAALVGYDVADAVHVLRGRLARPDGGAIRRVTLVWCLNDVYAGAPVAGVPGGGRVLGSPVAGWLRRHVRTLAWAKATFADRPLAYARFDAALYRPDRPHLAGALVHLDTLAGLARRAGVAVDVVLVPYEAQLRPENPATGEGDRTPQQRLGEALGARGIPVLDLAPVFAAAPDPPRLYLYGDGIHLSEAGHGLAAEAIARHARERTGAARR